MDMGRAHPRGCKAQCERRKWLSTPSSFNSKKPLHVEKEPGLGCLLMDQPVHPDCLEGMF